MDDTPKPNQLERRLENSQKVVGNPNVPLVLGTVQLSHIVSETREEAKIRRKLKRNPSYETFARIAERIIRVEPHYELSSLHAQLKNAVRTLEPETKRVLRVAADYLFQLAESDYREAAVEFLEKRLLELLMRYQYADTFVSKHRNTLTADIMGDTSVRSKLTMALFPLSATYFLHDLMQRWVWDVRGHCHRQVSEVFERRVAPYDYIQWNLLDADIPSFHEVNKRGRVFAQNTSIYQAVKTGLLDKTSQLQDTFAITFQENLLYPTLGEVEKIDRVLGDFVEVAAESVCDQGFIQRVRYTRQDFESFYQRQGGTIAAILVDPLAKDCWEFRNSVQDQRFSGYDTAIVNLPEPGWLVFLYDYPMCEIQVRYQGFGIDDLEGSHVTVRALVDARVHIPKVTHFFAI